MRGIFAVSLLLYAAVPAMSAQNTADTVLGNDAFVNHHEEQTGSLETGKLADLVVLEHNLFDMPQSQISQVHVLLTFMNGELVYGDLPL